MKFKPSLRTTKSGHPITIREAKLEDANALIHCMKAYLHKGYIPLTKDEFDPSEKEQQQWMHQYLRNDNNLLLVVEHNNNIIGNIDLTCQGKKMLNHNGHLGMGIHPDWQNQGIGRILFDTIIAWSSANATIETLWLRVFSNNHSGIHLYQTMGFEINARQANYIKTLNNEYIDNLIMTLKVS